MEMNLTFVFNLFSILLPDWNPMLDAALSRLLECWDVLSTLFAPLISDYLLSPSPIACDFPDELDREGHPDEAGGEQRDRQ